jgi:hypothetical protein
MDPLEALERGICRGTTWARRHPSYVNPGSVVAGMGDVEREALARLSSSHLIDLRNDQVAELIEDRHAKDRELRLEFDRRIRLSGASEPSTSGRPRRCAPRR